MFFTASDLATFANHLADKSYIFNKMVLLRCCFLSYLRLGDDRKISL